MHFACGFFEIGGFWCKIEQLIIVGRFRANGARNRRKVDHSGSNAYLQTSVHLLGADFDKANRPHSSQQLLSPRDPPLLGGCEGPLAATVPPPPDLKPNDFALTAKSMLDPPPVPEHVSQNPGR